MLLDNAGSHTIPDSLSNIAIKFLPSNTTAHLQPLDAGIFWSFKCKYRKEQVIMYLNMLEKQKTLSKISIKDAIYMTMNAWKAESVETIQNCWRKVDIVDGNGVDTDLEEDTAWD